MGKTNGLYPGDPGGRRVGGKDIDQDRRLCNMGRRCRWRSEYRAGDRHGQCGTWHTGVYDPVKKRALRPVATKMLQKNDPLGEGLRRDQLVE